MFLIDTDTVRPGTPNYDSNNSMLALMRIVERSELSAERDFYLSESLQYLVPFSHLELYGPAAGTNTDPKSQDDKNDFQKQNVASFRTTDTILTRGLASTGDWTGPFVRLSYRAGPDSKLSQLTSMGLGDRIRVWASIGGTSVGQPLVVPYNARSARYEIELWGYPGGDLRNKLDEKGQRAFDSGAIVVRPDLVKSADFSLEALTGKDVANTSKDAALHPIAPLHIEMAWANEAQNTWDSQSGSNYHYEFNMIVRGWTAYEQAGTSSNPHGGVGMLEFRNLLSNYFMFAGRGELARTIEPWMFDAYGNKAQGTRTENFMAVDYMDLHILQANCAIGLHRHRDNQEIFFLLDGRGIMVVGDWAKLPQRERCFEIRTLRPGHFAMLKGGNLHGIVNPTDSEASLFMFGGYD
jgi:mannose-6-phosphate isomerase-like protein (cupin superfamily)